MYWERVGRTAADRGLPVAVGGSVAPHRLLEAHRHGCFPYARHAARGPAGRGRYTRQVACGLVFAFPPDEATAGPELTWWSPPRRPVLPVASGQFADRLARSRPDGLPPWIVTCDHAFPSIVEGCRDLAGCDWITGPLRSAQLALHRAGWAHSIEVWEGERLIAGLFGIGMGRVFSVDAAFGGHPSALRVAFADLSRRLGDGAELIDVQADRGYGDFLELGSISRERYVEAVHAVDLPTVLLEGVLAVQPTGLVR